MEESSYSNPISALCHLPGLLVFDFFTSKTLYLLSALRRPHCYRYEFRALLRPILHSQITPQAQHRALLQQSMST